MADQLGFIETTQPVKRTAAEVETWLTTKAKPIWLAEYEYLRTQGLRHYEAVLSVWLSLSKDDRGNVQTRDDLARVLGVARATTYEWEAKHPQIREQAEALQVRRLRGSRLADVDERTYQAAIAVAGTAKDRQLYYQRAGVWEEAQRVRVVGDDDDQPYADVTEGEIEAIRRALSGKDSGGGTPG
jgi:hypothetical protein